MQNYNFCFNPFNLYHSVSNDAKQQFITPPQMHLHFNFSERINVINRIKLMEQRCSQLQIQNQELKIKVFNEKKATIKIEASELRVMVEQDQIENKLKTFQSKKIQKSFKKRRAFSELDKNFRCPYTDCDKYYASYLALNLHMRVKHKGGTKRQRKELLKKIVQAEVRGDCMPLINLNFPPNYIYQKKKLLLSCQESRLIPQTEFGL